jgi:predicted nucleotidyltransferase component of viral defense system
MWLMNLFDELVNTALKNQPGLSLLRNVVEKELLHHDILKILSNNNLLKDLTFIGGTAIRSCYAGVRLSEDLDFTGGIDFSKVSLSEMGAILTESLYTKYGLRVVVAKPVKEIKNVATWKIRIETRPEQRHLPTQRIHIDICSVPSYEKQPRLLINPYGVDLGTSGLVIQVQSLEEIYSDKLLALSFRPNRIKFRDLWDILWLHQRGIKPNFELIPRKLKDRNITEKKMLSDFKKRIKLLSENNENKIVFEKEMRRFLPQKELAFLEQTSFWNMILFLLTDLEKRMLSVN